MSQTFRRPALLTAVIAFITLLTAATQGAKFPGGVFKTSDGTNNIAIDFDSTGVMTAFVNGETFSSATWEARADTLTVGTVTGPEGYSCATSGRYLWTFAENRLTLTIIADECQVRRDAFVGLVWTRG